MRYASLALVALIVLAGAALASLWYRHGEPDAIQPDETFELQFGRGSGWHGLDVLRITSDGKAVYEYQTDLGIWERKRFALDAEVLADLRGAIGTLNPWEMDREYHANVCDGMQRVLLIRVEGKSKLIYFNSQFPDGIKKFAGFVDRNILQPFAGPVEAEIAPARRRGIIANVKKCFGRAGDNG